MELIIENALGLDGSIEDELNESSGNTERNYYLTGVFSTPDEKNRNGRVYSKSIWEREVANYQKEIKAKTVNTLGEWQHPPRSTIDPMKAVMRITELKFKDDGKVWGKCKILNNNSPETNALKGLIKEGIKIGVSTRGVGKVSATGVVEEYKMITADLVDLPSDYNEFVNGIAQDKEYKIDENGCVGEACKLELKELSDKIDNALEMTNENVSKLRNILVKIAKRDGALDYKGKDYDAYDFEVDLSDKEIIKMYSVLYDDVKKLSDWGAPKPINEKTIINKKQAQRFLGLIKEAKSLEELETTMGFMVDLVESEEKVEENCPIKAKIDETVEEAKKEIYSNIDRKY